MQSLQPEPAARYRNVLEALWRIARTEGVWRPMRGMNITATGAGPAHALYFACYEKLKKTLSDVIHAGGNSHVANGTAPDPPAGGRGGRGLPGAVPLPRQGGDGGGERPSTAVGRSGLAPLGRRVFVAAGPGCHGCPKALRSLQPRASCTVPHRRGAGQGEAPVLSLPEPLPGIWLEAGWWPAPALAQEDAGGRELPADEPGPAETPWVGAGARSRSAAWFWSPACSGACCSPQRAATVGKAWG